MTSHDTMHQDGWYSKAQIECSSIAHVNSLAASATPKVTKIMDSATATGGKIAGKVALNMIVPGAGSLVDFGEAIYDVTEGNYVSAVTNVAFGVIDLCTLGLFGASKAVAQETAKQTAVNIAKETAKSTKKSIGKEAAKQLAKSVPKEFASEIAEEAIRRSVIKSTAKQAAQKVQILLVKDVVLNTGKIVIN